MFETSENMDLKNFETELPLLDNKSAVRQAITMISKCGFDWDQHDDYETEVTLSLCSRQQSLLQVSIFSFTQMALQIKFSVYGK